MADPAHGIRRGGSALVLIADPKQAIYAFRGADVYAYLDAAVTAGVRATLPINWRWDQGLIDASTRYWAASSSATTGSPTGRSAPPRQPAAAAGRCSQPRAAAHPARVAR